METRTVLQLRSKLVQLLLLCFIPICATGQWINTGGPSSGNINTFFDNGSSLLIGTEAGAYQTTNDGESWEPYGLRDTVSDIKSFAKHGKYVFKSGNGLGRTSDNGMSWEWLSGSFTSSDVNAVASNSNYVFAATRFGLWRSSDEGSSWVVAGSIFADKTLLSVAARDSVIFTGLRFGGLYRSSDNGMTWDTVGSWLMAGSSITCIYFDGSDIYTGLYGGGVCRSTDNGLTWTHSTVGMDDKFVMSIVKHDSKLYAATADGIFASIDSGITWTSVSGGLVYTYVISLTSYGGALFCGTRGGVYRMKSGETTWTKASSFLSLVPLIRIRYSDSTLYTIDNRNSIFMSSDNGSSWRDRIITRSPELLTSFLPSGDTILAGTSKEVWYSWDKGKTWDDGSLPITKVMAITKFKNMFVVGAESGYHTSTNGGKNWEKVSDGPKTDIYSMVDVGGTIYSATRNGLYQSVAPSEGWYEVPISVLNRPEIGAVAYGNGVLVAGSRYDGIALSTDNGTSWVRGNISLVPGETITDLVYSDSVFYATTTKSVYRSGDSGANWKDVGYGVLPGSGAFSVAVNATDIFLSTAYDGVWKRSLANLSASGSLRSSSDIAKLQNHPNPVTGTTTFTFELTSEGYIKLSLYDVIGNKVKILANAFYTKGEHHIPYDASVLASGIYMYTLETTSGSSSGRLIKY